MLNWEDRTRAHLTTVLRQHVFNTEALYTDVVTLACEYPEDELPEVLEDHFKGLNPINDGGVFDALLVSALDAIDWKDIAREAIG